MKTLLFALIALLGITVGTPEAQANGDRYYRYSGGHRHYYPRYYTSRPRYYYYARPTRYYYSSYPRYYHYPRTYYRRPGISLHFGF